MMFLNIVTPCSRPENLQTIATTINIPKENYRWIIVFDLDEFPEEQYIPENCEKYLHRNPKSVVGHSQRNFALDLIDKGFVYMNDDDTAIHPDLWENIKNVDEDVDFITFAQLDTMNCLRLTGQEVKLERIDSHNYMVSRELIGDIRWQFEKYDADGLFAMECYKHSKKHLYIPKVLSIYNWLRIFE